jgi:hypothetical protein
MLCFSDRCSVCFHMMMCILFYSVCVCSYSMLRVLLCSPVSDALSVLSVALEIETGTFVPALKRCPRCLFNRFFSCVLRL